MQRPLILIDSINKQYSNSNEYSLRDMSLSIYTGEKFGVFGPNGAGKTTFISILSGLLLPSSGTVAYQLDSGSPTAHELKSIIGLVPQEYSLYEDLTALQNLEYFGALYNIPKSELLQRCNDLLNTLGLLGGAHKKVRHFSGGMKRRLNLAIGIIHNPQVLFLDEPTVGVDIQSKNAIITFLNLLNSQGTTIIYTSHHLSEAEEFCDRIAILDHGQLIACDVLSVLLQKYNAPDLQTAVLQLTGEAYRDDV